jgi:hypothetical protein
MKKFFLILLGVVAMTAFVSCKEETVITDKLPETANTFLNTYFDGIEVIVVVKESDGYEVGLVDGTNIDFRLDGTWKKVDCDDRAVPEGFFPEKISNYVKEVYTVAYIEEIEFDNDRYKVGLNYPRDVNLFFDSEGNFIGFDD